MSLVELVINLWNINLFQLPCPVCAAQPQGEFLFHHPQTKQKQLICQQLNHPWSDPNLIG